MDDFSATQAARIQHTDDQTVLEVEGAGDHLQTETLSHMEYNLFADYVHKIGWKPDYYIYLRADPGVCFERIHKRSRNAENGVTLEYIKTVHEMYEKFTETLKNIGITVFVVNANQSPECVLAAVERILYTMY